MLKNSAFTSIPEEENRKEKGNEPKRAYLMSVHSLQLQHFYTVENVAITGSIPEYAEKSPFNRIVSKLKNLSWAEENKI